MRVLQQDLRFGFRVLRKNPAFTLVAVLTLTLGIAANTTVFSWIDGLLWHPLPEVPDSSQIVAVETITPGTGVRASYFDYRDYRDQMKSLASLAAYTPEVLTVGDQEGAEAVWGEVVSGNYFDVMRVKPILGRVFAPEEYNDKPGAAPYVVVSERYWRRKLMADPSAVGKTLRVNRHELTVIGVVPARFIGAVPGLLHDLWVPISMGKELEVLNEGTFKWRSTRNLYMIGRLKPGVPIEQANADAARISKDLAREYPLIDGALQGAAFPIWQSHDGPPDVLLAPLRILMAVAVVVLLIVCANVANLLLARSVARQKEYGIRLALGAARNRLVRQAVTETALLSVAAALVAVPLSLWISSLLPLLIPNVGIPVAPEVPLNWRILVFTLLTCILAALVASVAPSLLLARSDVNDTLKQNARGGSSGSKSASWRGLLVAGEVALACVALVSAGLLIRSFDNARHIDPGFERKNVLLSRFYIVSGGYKVDETLQFSRQLTERLQSAPGVQASAYSDFVPLGAPAGPWHDVEPQGYVPAPSENMKVGRNSVSPGFFDLLRIPLLSGRDFRQDDTRDSNPVIIVNETFAQKYFAGANPVGRKVKARGRWFTIIGLVRDNKYYNPAEQPRPFFYLPFTQGYQTENQLYFYLKTMGDPNLASSTLRAQVAAIDPAALSYLAVPLADYTDVTMIGLRVAAVFLAGLGLLSLLLAALGLYGVMSYAVTQRTQEMGIRVALGARPSQVARMVIMQGMRLTLLGTIVGLVAAFAANRLLSTMLVKVSSADPLTFVAAVLFLALVALGAIYLPARRATHVDPMVALRSE
jgi:predicted permease